jgi:hypothetical protein
MNYERFAHCRRPHGPFKMKSNNKSVVPLLCFTLNNWDFVSCTFILSFFSSVCIHLVVDSNRTVFTSPCYIHLASTFYSVGFFCFFSWILLSFSHYLLCYKTIVINAHIVYVPCGPLIGELIKLWHNFW